MPLYLTNIDLEVAAVKHNIPLVSVFSKDNPPKQLIPGGYIINLQDAKDSGGNQLPGSHWTAMWIETKNRKPWACYFDPFGIAPPLEIQHILNKYTPYDINTTQIQSLESGVCGYYCIYFLWFMSRNKGDPKTRFKKFLDLFDDRNPRKNRRILDDLLKKT